MNDFRFRVYYQWDGPSHSDPFAKEKTPQEVNGALRQFPSELRHRLQDPAAEIATSDEGDNEVMLSVRTNTSHEAFAEALAATLKSWRLYGDEQR